MNEQEELVNRIKANPNLEDIESCVKPVLLELVKHFQVLGVKPSQRKAEIKQLLLETLVDEGLLPEDVLGEFKHEPVEGSLELRRYEMELQHKAEQARLERESREEQARLDRQLREREIQDRLPLDRELKEKEIVILKEIEEKKIEAEINKPFDVTRNVRMVPPFSEKEVDKYFSHFEQVAESLKWPKGTWVMLLQTVLKGKAQEIFSASDSIQCSDYITVKDAILKAYELVPEAYRQKILKIQEI